MKLNTLLLYLLPLFCLYSTLEAGDNNKKREADAEYRELIESQARILDTDIVFYGIVKDQHEQPVSDVEVVFKELVPQIRTVC